MNLLINCSNLKNGGGLQVADSVCGQLNRFKQHKFVVVLSTFLAPTKVQIKDFENVYVATYNVPDSYKSIVCGRDNYLDGLVSRFSINAVLTIFGPSRWKPRVPHLSGFALPQVVMPGSPFFQRMSFIERLKWKAWVYVRKWSLKRSADCFWTENPYISILLGELFQNVKIYTVSNYYNQVFDTPQKWKRSITLPFFDGITCLSVSSPTSHKNFRIIEGVIQYLRKTHPEFKVRFVLTFSTNMLPVEEDVRDNIVFVGKTDVTECPYLYEQADIMFMPTLMECFTATYPEAMRMEVPIVTTDLEFARGLCADAACYYNALDPAAAAEAIYKVATDSNYRLQLIANGKERLKKFDNYEQRADKLVRILEEMVKGSKHYT